ncbi:hypothetical protein [Curtobacterium sp. MCSS17_006]|uniref:hypothetical protein n=1 Tax=Curtobacterium sp. MCSS17_006 TaxID=2175642 RepID=UPI0011B3AB86|nr:hypothetical protein [Curtobacterium sp. MCSS17_006]
MANIDVVLERGATRQKVRDALAALEGVGPADQARLHLPPSSGGKSPLDDGRLMQAIISWGRSNGTPVLVAGEVAERAHFSARLAKDDAFLLAAGLSSEILDEAGVSHPDLTAFVLSELGRRNSFSAETDLPGAVLLARHIPRLNRSINLHTPEHGEWAVGENARTLYHRIWADPMRPASLRRPHVPLGETIFRSADGSYLSRVTPDGEAIRTLGERLYSPSKAALDLVRRSKISNRRVEDEVGEVLYELVQNTEWHAKQLAPGKTGKGFRVLSGGIHVIRSSRIEAATNDDPPLGRYVRNVFDLAGASQAGGSEAKFASITLLDSGIGLARSAAIALGQEHLYGPLTQVNYLASALEKTVRVSHRQMGNIGLPRVQTLMSNLGGFISIRTGSLEIHRDFIAHPLVPSTVDRTSAPRFIDWVPENFDEFEVGLHAGTAVTIVLPVDLKVS